jgi:hypothetical protein
VDYVTEALNLVLARLDDLIEQLDRIATALEKQEG